MVPWEDEQYKKVPLMFRDPNAVGGKLPAIMTLPKGMPDPSKIGGAPSYAPPPGLDAQRGTLWAYWHLEKDQYPKMLRFLHDWWDNEVVDTWFKS